MNTETVAGVSRAGQKIRAFRKAQQPRLSGEALAKRLEISKAHFYRIESEGRVPDHATALALVEMGICDHEDFHMAAVAECSQCSLPADYQQVQQCTVADCPRRAALSPPLSAEGADCSNVQPAASMPPVGRVHGEVV